MKASKSRVSWFKKQVESSIPDGIDIFGFPGISKAILLNSLDESYDLLDLFEPYQSRFETIFLEREIATLYDKASKLSKIDFSQNHSEFNDFLSLIQKLRVKIKEAYILLSKEPIKAEIELQKLKDEIVVLDEGLSKIKPIFAEINQIRESSDLVIQNLQSTQIESIEKKSQIDNFLTEINSLKTKADKSSGQIKSWEDKYRTTNEEFLAATAKYNDLNRTLESLKEENEKQFQLIKHKSSELETQVELNGKFQDVIQKTIDDVNRSGMAGSFKKRKDELSIPYWFWTLSTISTIITLIIIATHIIFNAIQAKELNYSFLLLRLPIFAAFVWLGWFCAKQFGFVSRIREDYSYKYAVSMAFEGYKKEARDVDQELLKKLLETTINNVSNSPLNIFDTKNNHGTPAHELLQGISKKRKSQGHKSDSENINTIEIED